MKERSIQGSQARLGGGNSNIFVIHPKIGGRWTHFDFRIFIQMGWFNHQLPGDDPAVTKLHAQTLEVT